MLDENAIPDVSSEEFLARYVLFSSHIRKKDKTLKPDAFVPHPYQDLSVTRHLQASEDELWLIGMAVAAAREKTLHGRGDVTADACLQQNLRVAAKPVTGNPNHADISNWPSDKPAQKLIALEVADRAIFVPTPNVTPH